VCIDDVTTRQACLDKWVDEYEFTPRNCFMNMHYNTQTNSDGEVYAYLLYYGGCYHLSIDVWFDRTTTQWNNLEISSDSNIISDASQRKTFNLKTGGTDKVGFRVP